VRRAVLGALVLAFAGAAAGQTLPEIHGADAIFAGAGVSVVWSVLRGADEASTSVVITVIGRAPSVGAVAAEGVDPFTARRVPRAAPASLPAALRVPRAAFADHPRTELRLAARVEDLVAGQPALVVYFTGVPDATPEFTDEGARSAWVARALAGRR
jgi:hypothetical protein